MESDGTIPYNAGTSSPELVSSFQSDDLTMIETLLLRQEQHVKNSFSAALQRLSLMMKKKTDTERKILELSADIDLLGNELSNTQETRQNLFYQVDDETQALQISLKKQKEECAIAQDTLLALEKQQSSFKEDIMIQIRRIAEFEAQQSELTKTEVSAENNLALAQEKINAVQVAIEKSENLLITENNKLQKIQQELETLINQLNGEEAQKKKIELQLIEVQKKVVEVEQDFNKKKSDLSDLVSEKENIEIEFNLLRDSYKDTEVNYTQLKENNSSVVEALKAQIELDNCVIETLKKEKKDADTNILTLQSSIGDTVKMRDMYEKEKLDLDNLTSDINQMRNTIKRLKTEQKNDQETLSKLQSTIVDIEKEKEICEKKHTSLKALRTEIAELTATTDELRNIKLSRESDVAILKESIDDVKTQTDVLLKEKAEADCVNDELLKTKKNVEHLKANKELIETELSNLESSLTDANRQKQVYETSKLALDALHADMSSLNCNIDNLKKEKDTSEAELIQLQIEVQNIVQQQEECKKQKATIETLTTAIDQLKRVVEALDEEKAAVEIQLSTLQQDIFNITKQKDACQQQKDILEADSVSNMNTNTVNNLTDKFIGGNFQEGTNNNFSLNNTHTIQGKDTFPVQTSKDEAGIFHSNFSPASYLSAYKTELCCLFCALYGIGIFTFICKS